MLVKNNCVNGFSSLMRKKKKKLSTYYEKQLEMIQLFINGLKRV